MAPQRNAQTASMSMVVFHKTRMCAFYQKGCCSRGARCVFAHSRSELLPPPDFSHTRLCERLVATGWCDVAGCMYAHDRKELRRRKSTEAEIASRAAPQKAAIGEMKADCKVRLQTYADVDDNATVCSPFASLSRQSTEGVDFGSSSPGSTCRSFGLVMEPMDSTPSAVAEEDAKAEATGGTTDEIENKCALWGFEVSVQNSFSHFGPSARAPFGAKCRSSSLPPLASAQGGSSL
mmetsp:Transcript_25894/g.59781  ORF Transcript_25894/g.59781 Transcript_25894/m.59781 type:complete len:235 (+) Transcript_25894:73-777(+)